MDRCRYCITKAMIDGTGNLFLSCIIRLLLLLTARYQVYEANVGRVLVYWMNGSYV